MVLRIILLSAGLTGSFLTSHVSAETSSNAQGAPSPASVVVDDSPTDPSTSATEEPAATSVQGADAGDDVWSRIRDADRIEPTDHPHVAAYRERYTREAMWISKIMERGTAVLGHLVAELDARGLPPELALLPAVESGYQPSAISTGKASGIWQIIPVTASEMGLQLTSWFDGRADLVNSTDAALDYLTALNRQFEGDWALTLAAYNAGPGRVQRAIHYNRERGEPTDYWSLPLPQETRNYVPKLYSLLQLVEADVTDAAVTALELPAIPIQTGFTEVDAGSRISLDRAAGLAGLPEHELRYLNAGWIHGVTAPEGPHTLYLPNDTVERFHDALQRTEATRLLSLPSTHQVIEGDSLGGIAERYGVSIKRLRSLNSLASENLRIGQQLAVRERGVDDGTLDYVVASGDSLSAIAKRYSVELEAVTTTEGEVPDSHIIHPGQRLKINLPAAGAI